MNHICFLCNGCDHFSQIVQRVVFYIISYSDKSSKLPCLDKRGDVRAAAVNIPVPFKVNGRAQRKISDSGYNAPPACDDSNSAVRVCVPVILNDFGQLLHHVFPLVPEDVRRLNTSGFNFHYLAIDLCNVL